MLSTVFVMTSGQYAKAADKWSFLVAKVAKPAPLARTAFEERRAAPPKPRFPAMTKT